MRRKENVIRAKCPWCEAPMDVRETGGRMFVSFAAVCTRCGAQGPKVSGMGDRQALMERALNRAIRGQEDRE